MPHWGWQARAIRNGTTALFPTPAARNSITTRRSRGGPALLVPPFPSGRASLTGRRAPLRPAARGRCAAGRTRPGPGCGGGCGGSAARLGTGPAAPCWRPRGASGPPPPPGGSAAGCPALRPSVLGRDWVLNLHEVHLWRQAPEGVGIGRWSNGRC